MPYTTDPPAPPPGNEPGADDARQHAPAAARNRDPILAVLQAALPRTGTVLEIASGTGEHAVYFAPRLQPRRWLPSDIDSRALASIRAWLAYQPAANLLAPRCVDVCTEGWQDAACAGLSEPVTAVVAINMLHIAPFAACRGLFAGAARVLPATGCVLVYGPFRIDGEHTAPSNAAFDESLRAQNPSWGVRDTREVGAVAAKEGLIERERIAMPANNFILVFAPTER